MGVWVNWNGRHVYMQCYVYGRHLMECDYREVQAEWGAADHVFGLGTNVVLAAS